MQPRLWVVLMREATCLLEIIFALFAYYVRGVSLILVDMAYDPFLRTVKLNEDQIGTMCLLLGTLHILAVMRGSYWHRALVSLGGIALAFTMVLAPLSVDPPHWVSAMAFWASVLLIEFYILLRHLLVLEERRRRR